jgi:hypothetical protein
VVLSAFPRIRAVGHLLDVLHRRRAALGRIVRAAPGKAVHVLLVFLQDQVVPELLAVVAGLGEELPAVTVREPEAELQGLVVLVELLGSKVLEVGVGSGRGGELRVEDVRLLDVKILRHGVHLRPRQTPAGHMLPIL